MSKKISQRDARRMRKELAALWHRDRNRANCYIKDWPGGVHLGWHRSAEKHDATMVQIEIARKLGHYVIAVNGDDGIEYYAVKP